MMERVPGRALARLCSGHRGCGRSGHRGAEVRWRRLCPTERIEPEINGSRVVAWRSVVWWNKWPAGGGGGGQFTPLPRP